MQSYLTSTGDKDGKPDGLSSQKLTVFSEFQTIEIAIKIIDLLQVLHEKNIIHTNLNPDTIFLVNSSIDLMCFLNLYHASW